MPSGIRAYARSRGIPRSTVAQACEDGRMPLLPDGRIDEVKADELFLARWRPNVRTHSPRLIQPRDPAEEAAATRALLAEGGLTEPEIDAFLEQLRG